MDSSNAIPDTLQRQETYLEEADMVAESGLSVTTADMTGDESIECRENCTPEATVLDVSSPVSCNDSDVQETICCRICFEAIKEIEFKESKALRLGCKCLDGMDIVHLKCAKKWFRLRRSPDCEVCGAPAASLPERLKNELKQQKEQDLHVYFASDNIPLARDAFEPIPGWKIVSFCVAPAVVSAILLILYLYWSLHMELGSAIVLAFGLSTVTVIHWLSEPQKCAWHLVFVTIHASTIIGITTTFYDIYKWQSVGASIGGCMMGSLTSIGLYTAFRAVCLLCFPSLHLWGSEALADIVF